MISGCLVCQSVRDVLMTAEWGEKKASWRLDVQSSESEHHMSATTLKTHNMSDLRKACEIYVMNVKAETC